MNNDLLTISVVFIAVVNLIYFIVFIFIAFGFFKLYKKINLLLEKVEHTIENFKTGIFGFIIKLIKDWS